MVRLDVITTRGGDAGETSLGDGSRVRKDALRVEAYGTVDELNAVLGLLRLHLDAEADSMVARIQNDPSTWAPTSACPAPRGRGCA